MAVHDQIRRAITLHFAGRGSRESERALRSHCAECAECHDYYERHLLLSELDPSALGASERIGRGLGFSTRRRLPGVGGVLLLAAAALFWLGPHGAPDAQFTARGALPERNARLDVYLVHPSRCSEATQKDCGAAPVPSSISADAELAFAYASTAQHPYLMVFGVDEHGHVYWYHPEWTDPRADPVARSVSTQPGTFELPEAVNQALDGRKLAVLGLFSKTPLHVREVERELNSALAEHRAPAPALRAAFKDSLVIERELEVEQ